jgi:hypothetical protein
MPLAQSSSKENLFRREKIVVSCWREEDQCSLNVINVSKSFFNENIMSDNHVNVSRFNVKNYLVGQIWVNKHTIEVCPRGCFYKSTISHCFDYNLGDGSAELVAVTLHLILSHHSRNTPKTNLIYSYFTLSQYLIKHPKR